MTIEAPWESRTWSAPLADPRYRANVWARIQRAIVVTSTDCWEWQQHCTPDGYGVVSVKRRMVRTHQVSLALARGHIWTTDLHVDHLCRNRCCCNPDHLELVTPAENFARGLGGVPGSLVQASKTHCPRGHPYDEKNTYVHPTKGHRLCKPCRAFRERERQRRIRAGVDLSAARAGRAS